jgi:hypothetical protein
LKPRGAGAASDAFHHHLLAAHESGEDAKPGGIGGGPEIGTEVVAVEVEDGAGAGLSRITAADGACVEQLMKAAVVIVYDDHLAVAIAVRASFDRGV